VKKFGTDDPSWSCAAEQLLNTIFSLKQVKAYKKAELFLHGLLKKLSSDHADVISQIEEEIKERKEIEIDEKMFDKDLNFNENMLTQVIFVAGHLAIKMLVYIEYIDKVLEK
jgi:hypothetical protein